MDSQSRDLRDGILLNREIAGFFGVGTFPVSNTALKLDKNMCVRQVGLSKWGRSGGGADIRISLSIGLQH